MLDSMRGVVTRVHEDALVAPALAESGPLVGAPAAWNVGFDGTGSAIAVLDTGVDKQHPFLAGKIVDEACFSSAVPNTSLSTCPNGLEEQIGPGSGVPCTFAGCHHGTHVAGISAGNGAEAVQPFSGIARGAQIVAIQVFSLLTTAQACDGAPPCLRAFTSDLIAGLERVYILRASHKFGAVNMSLASGQFSTNCDGDPIKPMIDTLRSVQIATVTAAGQEGLTNALAYPGCVSTAISVGSTTKSDTISSFSNVAAFLSLFAPGSSITSSVPGGDFARLSGTSMASAHVAGAFAILKQAVPGASVSQMLQALQVTGRPITDVTGITKARIQVDAALNFFGLPALSVFVSGLYQDVLGRQPDPAGLSAWAGFLLANCTTGGFSATGVAFYDSMEFRTLRPLTLNGLVTSLYRAFLDRDPEPGGLLWWGQHFRDQRVAVATGFIRSAEFRSLRFDRTDRAAVTAVVTRFYEEILGRAPEPGGLTSWVNYIAISGDLEGTAVAFITSSEFEGRPLTFRDYVAILYRAFLARNPDAGGLDSWDGVLRQGLIHIIQAGFVPSAEFQSKVPQLCGR
jgi:Subtilase family/Domain of unknown function (DUF4214)